MISLVVLSANLVSRSIIKHQFLKRLFFKSSLYLFIFYVKTIESRRACVVRMDTGRFTK